jgi:hypothetical protein
MPQFLYEQLRKLPRLHTKKNPTWALVIGFLTGGIGLGIYLRSFVDMLIPIVLYFGVLAFSQQAQVLGWTLGPMVVAVYGYFRVQESNDRPVEATV